MWKWRHIAVSLRCECWQIERGLLDQIYETQSSDLSLIFEREREREEGTNPHEWMNEEQERLWWSTSWVCGVYESHWWKHKTNSQRMSRRRNKAASLFTSMCFCHSNNMPRLLSSPPCLFLLILFWAVIVIYCACEKHNIISTKDTILLFHNYN